MDAQQERALEAAMNKLDPQSLKNLKAHADSVDHEKHPSTDVILKWVAGSIGVLFGPGMIWKLIKKIKTH